MPYYRFTIGGTTQEQSFPGDADALDHARTLIKRQPQGETSGESVSVTRVEPDGLVEIGSVEPPAA